jgi:RHS repeat-associated protein
VYDTAGHATSFGGFTYGYNDRGRMKTSSEHATNYLYNALGQMIEKSGTLGTTLFMQDEAGHLIGEYSSTGALVEETIWLGDIPVATLRPHSGGGIDIYYVHTDHLNSPRKVQQQTSHTLAWRLDSDPFNTAAPNQNPGSLGTFVYNLRFPGQYYMAETGLHYNYFRDYDSATGRYVESDPIGLDGALSTYEYGDSNPIEMTDPYGLQAIPVPTPRPVPLPWPTPGSQPVPGGKQGSAASNALSGAMSESGADRSDIGRPYGRGRVWCLIRCQGNEILGPGQGKGTSQGSTCCPPWIYGLGLGTDPVEAWNNAWDAANLNTPQGCQKQHCQGKAGSCKNWKGGKR